MFARVGLSCLVVCLLSATARADEAVRGDGSRLPGRLSFSELKRFSFRTQDREEPLADLDLVRFGVRPPSPPTIPLWHRLRLGPGEVLHGEVHSLDATHLYVRTSWAKSLAIPRPLLEQATHLPGSQPVLFDSFDGSLNSWKVQREPRTTDGSLRLDRDGQSLEATWQHPIATGVVAIGLATTRTKQRRVILELTFAAAKTSSTIRVELAGPGELFSVTSPSRPRLDARVVRQESARLVVEFRPDRLDISAGNLVLWSQAGAGELQGLKLLATGAGSEEIAIDDVLVLRSARPAELRDWADLTQDAVRNRDGTETYGQLTSVGSQGVVLAAKQRQVASRWSEVSAFAFRRGAVRERPTTGEHVRARVWAGDGTHDLLEGAVLAFDEKTLRLDHNVLGELVIPRVRLEEVRFLFHGRRVPVDSTPRHLGAKSAFGYSSPKPEGLRFQKSVDVPAVRGFVVIDAARLGGSGTPLEVWVGGQLLGDLNRQADRADAEVRRYRLPFPAGRSETLEVELRLKAATEGGRVNGVDLRSVRLELPEPR